MIFLSNTYIRYTNSIFSGNFNFIFQFHLHLCIQLSLPTDEYIDIVFLPKK
jgi:hypothetical protein